MPCASVAPASSPSALPLMTSSRPFFIFGVTLSETCEPPEKLAALSSKCQWHVIQSFTCWSICNSSPASFFPPETVSPSRTGITDTHLSSPHVKLSVTQGCVSEWHSVRHLLSKVHFGRRERRWTSEQERNEVIRSCLRCLNKTPNRLMLESWGVGGGKGRSFRQDDQERFLWKKWCILSWALRHSRWDFGEEKPDSCNLGNCIPARDPCECVISVQFRPWGAGRGSLGWTAWGVGVGRTLEN